MTKRTLSFMLILLLCMNIAALITLGYHKWSQYSGCVTEKNILKTRKPLCEQLSLSREQREQMIQIREVFNQKFIQINSEITREQHNLIHILNTEKPDTAQISIILDNINRLQGKLQKQVVDNLLKEKKILNSEQCHKYCGLIQANLLPDKQTCDKK